jgi:large subunit ribosomal protein L10
MKEVPQKVGALTSINPTEARIQPIWADITGYQLLITRYSIGMAKTREQKEQIISGLVDKLGRMKSLVFTSFTGLSVPDADELRSKCREAELDHGIAKKTLVKIALTQAGIQVDPSVLEGSVATTISYDDEVAPAKTIAEFAKTHKEKVTFLGGLLEGKFLDSAAVTALALVPSKPELYAKLVGSINSPVSGFVNVLAGNMRGLMNVLNGIKEQKS